MSEEILRYERERAKLEAAHAYDRRDERDACGVGLVVAIDGKPRREVVTMAIGALKSLWHRGAVDADGKTGDGAGILLDAPQDRLRPVSLFEQRGQTVDGGGRLRGLEGARRGDRDVPGPAGDLALRHRDRHSPPASGGPNEGPEARP